MGDSLHLSLFVYLRAYVRARARTRRAEKKMGHTWVLEHESKTTLAAVVPIEVHSHVDTGTAGGALLSH